MYAALAQQGRGYMWYGDGHMMGMHWGWWIFWLVVVVFLVWVVARTTGSGSAGAGQAPPPTAPRSPEEILRERFAKGELSEDEFRTRLQALEDSES